MSKLRDLWTRYRTWHDSRRVRRRRRTAETVADTAAGGVGFVLRTALKAVVTVLLIFITTGILFTCIFAVYVKTCLTEDLNVSLEEMSLSLSSTILYQDANGEWQELVKLYSDEDRIWVDYDKIPEDLEHAAVAIEDQRFYTHKGVDWYRTFGAFVTMFGRMSNTFGGSTITQQLIKNLTEYDDVTVQRKLLEIFRALEFEKIYTKEEIMTWYLNEIYLGERCYGVGTAARVYFGKEVNELDLAECASLIGITNNPSRYDPYISETTRQRNKERQETILWEMYDQGYITHQEYVDAKNEELVFQRSPETDRPTVIYSYYVDTVIRDVITDLAEEKGISRSRAEHLLYNGGYKVYSCVDMRIQNIVDNLYQNPSNLPSPYRSSSQPLQSAIVVIEPKTGDVVALCGGVGQKTVSLSGNHATLYEHPPGSSFKPLSVYAPALDLGIVRQSDTVNDSPNLRLSGTTWYPRNSGNSYGGIMTVRTALQYSKNTIAAQLLDRIGLDTSWDYLTNHFGLTTLVRDKVVDDHVVTDFAYSPLALGQLSYGVTVREMAQAYTSFVNDGKMSKSRTYSLITDDNDEIVLLNAPTQTVAIKANTAWNMCDMLQNAVSNGTGRDAYFSTTAVGGKTGTTSDDNDRYFVGFTNYYVCAVWTGHERSERMYYSNNPAAVIFRNVMSQIHAGYSYSSFHKPDADAPRAVTVYETEEPEQTEEPTPTPEVTDPPEAEPTATFTAPPAAETTPTPEPTTPSEPTPVAPTETPTPTEAPPPATEVPATPTPTPEVTDPPEAEP